jgi:putative glutamine amidotransferase
MVWKPDTKNPDKTNKFMRVNSFHHQGIKNQARNFITELIDVEDKVIEAISDSRNKIFAVQWHPERLLDNYSINSFRSILK